MWSFEGLDPFQARTARLAAWQSLGIDPFPALTPVAHDVAAARALADGFAPEQFGEEVTVHGRLMALRGQGALLFADLRDASGQIQILFQKDSLSEEWFERLQLLDLGDIVSVTGLIGISRRGEVSVRATSWVLLTKSMRPLPDSWKGLSDTETRFRQRYVDLIANPDVRERFVKKSKAISAIRHFMEGHGFLEVETPVLEPIPGGADAEPFITHHNALDVDYYLRISLELYQKRLIVGGFEKIFEIGRVFRNEGISPQHLQEFTNMEFYWAYASCEDLYAFTEGLYRAIVQAAFGTLQVQRGEHALDFSKPFPKRSYVELVEEFTGINVLTATDEELAAGARSYGANPGPGDGRGRLMDLLYKKSVRPHLIQPQFITDVPTAFSPLAKRLPSNPDLTDRVLVLVDGAEVGNGFSELNDPIDQRQRFEEQEKLREAGDAEAQHFDHDFVRALEYGMAPTAGFGLGIDRFLTILFDLDTIREMVLFPMLRPEKE